MRFGILPIMGFGFLWASITQAETFFYKDNDGKIQKTEINIKVRNDQSIIVSPSKILPLYTNDKDGLKSGPLPARKPTTAEEIADTAITVVTSFIILATHDTYDLSKDLRLSRVVGAIFFVFPVESSDIYRKCGDNEYLVAITNEPKDETLKQLKSLDEVRKLCDSAENPKPSS